MQDQDYFAFYRNHVIYPDGPIMHKIAFGLMKQVKMNGMPGEDEDLLLVEELVLSYLFNFDVQPTRQLLF